MSTIGVNPLARFEYCRQLPAQLVVSVGDCEITHDLISVRFWAGQESLRARPTTIQAVPNIVERESRTVRKPTTRFRRGGERANPLLICRITLQPKPDVQFLGQQFAQAINLQHVGRYHPPAEPGTNVTDQRARSVVEDASFDHVDSVRCRFELDLHHVEPRCGGTEDWCVLSGEVLNGDAATVFVFQSAIALVPSDEPHANAIGANVEPILQRARRLFVRRDPIGRWHMEQSFPRN